MQETISDRGYFKTAQASRYLQQLCKHLGHKVAARFDETSGVVDLVGGPLSLTAHADELVATVVAKDAEGLERARGIVDRHLERFAFRENFTTMEWAGAGAPSSAAS